LSNIAGTLNRQYVFNLQKSSAIFVGSWQREKLHAGMPGKDHIHISIQERLSDESLVTNSYKIKAKILNRNNSARNK